MDCLLELIVSKNGFKDLEKGFVHLPLVKRAVLVAVSHLLRLLLLVIGVLDDGLDLRDDGQVAVVVVQNCGLVVGRVISEEVG
jgi:hypothetical protein